MCPLRFANSASFLLVSSCLPQLSDADSSEQLTLEAPNNKSSSLNETVCIYLSVRVSPNGSECLALVHVSHTQPRCQRRVKGHKRNNKMHPPLQNFTLFSLWTLSRCDQCAAPPPPLPPACAGPYDELSHCSSPAISVD